MAWGPSLVWPGVIVGIAWGPHQHGLRWESLCSHLVPPLDVNGMSVEECVPLKIGCVVFDMNSVFRENHLWLEMNALKRL